MNSVNIHPYMSTPEFVTMVYRQAYAATHLDNRYRDTLRRREPYVTLAQQQAFVPQQRTPPAPRQRTVSPMQQHHKSLPAPPGAIPTVQIMRWPRYPYTNCGSKDHIGPHCSKRPPPERRVHFTDTGDAEDELPATDATETSTFEDPPDASDSGLGSDALKV